MQWPVFLVAGNLESRGGQHPTNHIWYVSIYGRTTQHFTIPIPDRRWACLTTTRKKWRTLIKTQCSVDDDCRTPPKEKRDPHKTRPDQRQLDRPFGVEMS